LGLSAIEQACSQPGFKGCNLFTDSAMRDKKFFGGLGEADMACGGFKGSDRIQGWKFSHTPILPKL
jgi:hypothetical protein